MSINVCFLMGNVGLKPVCRTAGNTKIANFTLATERKTKLEKVIEWHQIVAFGKLAELCEQYVDKGSMIHVTGEIRYEKYKNKDGQDVKTTKIVAQEIKFIKTQSRADNQQKFDYLGLDSDLENVPF